MEEDKKGNHSKTKLSPAATVLLTIAATLGAIVVARVLYFIFTGA